MVDHFDIAIIGAGPAGSTAALALKGSGLRVVLLDKANFPRDKICGDAIPSPSFKAIQSFSPKLAHKIQNFETTTQIKTSKIFTSNGRYFQFDWVLKAYNSTRSDFDNQLVQLVKEHSDTTVLEGEKALQIQPSSKHFIIESTNHQIHAKFLIGADGVNGICAKQLMHRTIDRTHHCAAVRAYYSNVKVTPGVNEFYLLKNHLPGYFWIFPLPENRANVGFGMLSEEISKRTINLRKTLKQIIEETPTLQEKFSNALLEDRIVGYGLPLGSNLLPLTGNAFLLCGDAGSLIDPLQGHGIDKAMWSGYYAAKQAISAFAANRFDKAFLKGYEKNVYAKYRTEFIRNYWIMKGLNQFPNLLNGLGLFFGKRANVE